MTMMHRATIDSFHHLWAQWMGDVKRIRNILALIGAMYVGKKTLNLFIPVVDGIYAHGFSRIAPVKLQESGSWAVVAGPTEGIGEAFAIALAKRGLNILLLDRNADKLQRVSEYIEKECQVETMIHTADFNGSDELYEDIEKVLECLDIGIFVNNAGFVNKCPCFIYELSEEDIKAMVNVNIKTVTTLTKLVIALMRNRKDGHRRYIVNVSCLASLNGVSLLSVYAATKAYVTSFSRAVHEEVCREGITVQTLIPSYVKTKMIEYSQVSHQSLFIPTPDTYVRHALYTLGYSTYTTGYWMHGVLAFLLDLCPHFIWVLLARRLNQVFRHEQCSCHED